MAPRNKSETFTDLSQFGPDSDPDQILQPLSLAESNEWCRRFSLSHDENFTVVSFLLPRKLRTPFYVLYAWCRRADDLGDEIVNDVESLRLLTWWESELNRAFAFVQKGGPSPQHPISLSLSDVLRQHPLPRSCFTDLLSAFRQDRIQTSYETKEELLEYCRRSANPVGRLLLALSLKNPPTANQLRWSDEICTGLQLANFWQDIRRDAEKGRCYIPREVMINEKERKETIRELVTWTRDFFRRGEPLLLTLSGRLRFEISLFRSGGLAILDKIEQIDCQTDQFRPKLTRWDKIRIILKNLIIKKG